MNKPKIVLASILAGIAAGVVSLGVPYGTPEKPWTPDLLRETLKSAGMPYESKRCDGAMRFRLPDSKIPWDELETMTVPNIVKNPGCLHIARLPGDFGYIPSSQSLKIGDLIVWGHPEELSRVAKAINHR